MYFIVIQVKAVLYLMQDLRQRAEAAEALMEVSGGGGTHHAGLCGCLART